MPGRSVDEEGLVAAGDRISHGGAPSGYRALGKARLGGARFVAPPFAYAQPRRFAIAQRAILAARRGSGNAPAVGARPREAIAGAAGGKVRPGGTIRHGNGRARGGRIGLMPLRSENLRGVTFMLTAMAAFTISDACVKHLASVLPLFQVITLRGIVTLPLMIVIARMSGGLNLGAVWRVRRLVGVRALAEVGSTVTFFAALLHLPLATVSAILQSLPLAITLAAAIFLGERVGWRRMGAILVGFAGVLVIIRPGAESFNIWSLMALLSVAIVVVRDLASRSLPP
ncbi:MAG: DMT family transporter, partial [Alphaproteobacteria bacterium]|nr:DMT family transporter [Alphaproteobacteria bacterium]